MCRPPNMPAYRLRLNLIVQSKLLLLTMLVVGVWACQPANNSNDRSLKDQLRKIDSLIYTAKGDSANLLLKKLRSKISADNPLICSYYYISAQQYIYDPGKIALYADSALAFFNTEDRINKYPREYFQALLSKGSACFKAKKFAEALSYYYKARKISVTTKCDNGVLSTMMAGIYFDQRNYKQAARYWAESYRLLEACKDMSNPQKMFYLKQGGLDNSGISYQRAGKLDSALYYYLADLKLINQADSAGIINKTTLNSSRAVLYDNLGGFYLKQKKLKEAEDYLTKCLACTYDDRDGSRIPPLLKLAELYLLTGRPTLALPEFKTSRDLLKRYSAYNRESEIRWNRLYAEYLFATKHVAEAYAYQNQYLILKDSLDSNTAGLYQLDVDRELNTIRQEQDLSDLTRRNNTKKIYLTGFIIIVLLTLVIIWLIGRSLKRVQKNSNSANLHNERLQYTLSELERVNKNYIRIMRVMAHDLRNPLSGMTGLASVLLGEDEFSAESKHMLKLIETTGLHTMEMINELLKSGLADENEKISRQNVDINRLLFDSVELLQFKAREKRQQIVLNSEGNPLMAKVNHEKLWRVFNNLIVNAIKFSHPGGIITVDIKGDDRSILISICDQGVGIREEEKDIVFEMFTEAKKVGTGGEQPFGLGLSISKKIIEKHYGKIWFESTPGVGTTFFIKLPANEGTHDETNS